MFWKYNPSSCPHLDVLLGKEDVTLYEVMDEEEVVQECKVQNKKLIEYLSRPEILETLVTLATEEPPVSLDEKIRYKYPNIACELLTCDVPQLNERLAGSEQLLAKLYSFLKSQPPLNPLLASYFSKTLAGLVTRRAEQNWYSYQFTCLQVLEFLKAQEDTVGLLIKNISTSAIMDLLLRIITGVEGNEMRSNVLSWLENERVIQRIIEILDPENQSERHCNAAQLLCDVIKITRENIRLNISSSDKPEPDPILSRLESPEIVSQILTLILSGGDNRSESAIIGGISVLLVLLDCSKPTSEDNLLLSGFNAEFSEHIQRIAASTARSIVPCLPDIHNVLLNPPKRAAVRTTAGVLDPPVGNTRIQLARLLAALISTQESSIHSKLAELSTLNVLLDLFFQYKWNNFLHSQVEQCVFFTIHSLSEDNNNSNNSNYEYQDTHGSSSGSPQPSATSVPESPIAVNQSEEKEDNIDEKPFEEKEPSNPAVIVNDNEEIKEPSPLLVNLFGECNILNRILTAYSNYEIDCATVNQTSGYYGHLILMSNTIVDKVSDKMLEKLVPDETYRIKWQEFIKGPLSEINRIQNEFLGGQHPARMVAQESEDGDYHGIPFPQEDSVLQTFTELQTRYSTTPFAETFGYDDNQFFDGEDPMHVADAPVPLGYRLGSSDEMERRSDLFDQVCKQKMMLAADDEELDDQDLTFQTAASSHSRQPVRTCLSSDSEEEEERTGPDGHEAPTLTMEVDSTDPWPVMDSITPVVDTDPWSNDALMPAVNETAETENWADFCSFDSPQGASASDDKGFGDFEEKSKDEDNNANPSGENSSELVDNFRFLSQGLMTVDENTQVKSQDESSVQQENLQSESTNVEDEKTIEDKTE